MKQILFAASLMLGFVPDIAFSHFDKEDTLQFSFSKYESPCIGTDNCKNTVVAEPNGKVAGTLSVQSSRIDTEKSTQAFVVRFSNTYNVPPRTTEVHFETAWRVVSTPTAAGASEVACQIWQSAHYFERRYGVIFVDGDVSTLTPPTQIRAATYTNKEIFREDKERGVRLPRQLPVYSEFWCVVSGAGGSQAEITLEEFEDLMQGSGLKHFHVTDQYGNPLTN